jgi:hypothetical protein
MASAHDAQSEGIFLMRYFRSLPVAAMAAVTLSGAAHSQSLQLLTNQPPFGEQISFQMTDGTVLAQAESNSGRWFKLTPDINGSYGNGTWTETKSFPVGYTASAFASAVLADGRLVVEGGEYSYLHHFTLYNKGAIYDPVADSWTPLSPPSGWNFIGDSPSVVLPDGRFVIGDKLHKWVASLDPKTLAWTALGYAGKNDFNAEEGWTLLPDGSILTADVKDAPNTERYVPGKQAWLSAGATPVDLASKGSGRIKYGKDHYYYPPGEIGPAILRPDGTVFATGALDSSIGKLSAHTAIYTPPSKGNPMGNWTKGPDFPNGDSAGDFSASLLPDGNVLVNGQSGELYEFDGTNLIDEKINISGSLFAILMVLPTGGVLIGGNAGAVGVYTTTGTYQTSWQPTVSTYPTSVTRGDTYQISGTQFNGLSQANAFGDEFQTPTNYPLVRITNNSTSHVFYARTHDHSTMGVATGSKTVSTNFDVPSSMETGPSSLAVVANGIPSAPVAITVN